MKQKALPNEDTARDAAGLRAPLASRLLGTAGVASFDGIFVLDREGMILEAGGAAEGIFGRPLDETVGLAIERLLIPPSPRAESGAARRGPIAVDDFPYACRNLAFSARHASEREFPVTVNLVEISGPGEARFLCIVRDVSQLDELAERSQQAESELQSVKEELRALALRLALDIEGERRRIARGLHDQVGNSLAMAKMGIGDLRRNASDPATLSALDEIEHQTAKAMQEIRTLTFELSSPVLYELGLEAALKSLGKRLAERHDIGVEFTNDGEEKPLSEDRQVILYRIVEELLVNVVKHAWASQARIAVERDDADIRITVEDDGVGPESLVGKVRERQIPGPDGGFGLYGVRQRLEHLDGRLDIEATFPSGTRVVVRAPLQLERD